MHPRDAVTGAFTTSHIAGSCLGALQVGKLWVRPHGASKTNSSSDKDFIIMCQDGAIRLALWPINETTAHLGCSPVGPQWVALQIWC